MACLVADVLPPFPALLRAKAALAVGQGNVGLFPIDCAS